MMKNKLAIALFTALAASGSAHASKKPIGGSWTGSLDFNGKITSYSPPWEFEVPAATQVLANNGSIDKSVKGGKVDGINTTWTIDALINQDILTGLLKNTPTGGVSLTPVITLGETGNTVTTNIGAGGGDCTTLKPCTVSLIATGTGSNSAPVAGTLTVNFETGLSIVYTGGELVGSTGRTNGISSGYASSHALRNLNESLTAQGHGYYDGVVNAANYTPAQLVNILNSPQNTNINAALVLQQIGAQVLSFPTATIPATWTASLPIEISVQ
ncbi:hypothetical protein [Vibrio crassostreae]|uniref:F4 family fimbrial subunit n=1 Tax=Vibrio crassostreae TaxID=246167 RepID=UPI00104DB916|nr:hypothetical protein [Vibrio crassostreae]TCW20770.1 hypothetical protein EDB48_103109 [Vibrio crassostreae]